VEYDVHIVNWWKETARHAQKTPQTPIEVREPLRRVLNHVRELVLKNEPVVYMQKPVKHELLITDACKEGVFAAWGAAYVYESGVVRVMSERFPIQVAMGASINELELTAVAEALERARPSNSNVLLLCDNTTAVNALRTGRSASLPIHRALGRVWRSVNTRRVLLFAYWIPSEENVVDALSREKGMSENEIAEALRLARTWKSGRVSGGSASLNEITYYSGCLNGASDGPFKWSEAQ
jgi:ribonuclease HI